MKACIVIPSHQNLDRFLKRQAKMDLSYPEKGRTVYESTPNYDNDHHQVFLGKGEAVWEKAKAALRSWKQFPATWTRIYPNTTPVVEGQNVAVLFRLLGIWWTNSARIIDCFDEPHRFGLAYGTLPGHVERGEERFWIERDAQGEITYHIRAFSRPAYWIVKIAYPFARANQKRFVRESMARMKTLAQASKKQTHA